MNAVNEGILAIMHIFRSADFIPDQNPIRHQAKERNLASSSDLGAERRAFRCAAIDGA